MIKIMRMTTAAAAAAAMMTTGGPLDGDGAENRHMNTEWNVEKYQDPPRIFNNDTPN